MNPVSASSAPGNSSARIRWVAMSVALCTALSTTAFLKESELRIDIPGATLQGVTGISSNGKNAVGFYTTAQGNFDFVWRAGKLTTFSLPGAPTFLSGVNARGDVIGVTFVPGTGQVAFLRRHDGSTVSISCPAPTPVRLAAINNAGTVIGSWENLDESVSGFRWRNDRCELLPVQDRIVSPNDISESGIIVGVASNKGGSDEFAPAYGFVLKGDEVATVEHPEAPFSNGGVTVLTDVAPNGLALGWSSPSVSRMLQGDLRWFLYRDGEFESISIPVLPREFNPLSISSAGAITYEGSDHVIRTFRVRKNAQL